MIELVNKKRPSCGGDSLAYAVFVNLKFLKSYRDQKKFLIAFNGNEIILNLSHLVNYPQDELNYFLGLMPGKDFSYIEIVKESRM